MTFWIGQNIAECMPSILGPGKNRVPRATCRDSEMVPWTCGGRGMSSSPCPNLGNVQSRQWAPACSEDTQIAAPRFKQTDLSEEQTQERGQWDPRILSLIFLGIPKPLLINSKKNFFKSCLRKKRRREGEICLKLSQGPS